MLLLYYVKWVILMSDFNSNEFGNKLRELRKSKGLSQENLANKLNISRTTIGRFESEK